ncbi:MAG: hypothetical protein MMC23_004893 [Stictis urceolatum]|nr:hypothetical protein [Stictis urceolata]
MSTPTPYPSKPTPRGPTSAATPITASSPSYLPPHAHPKASKSPHKPTGTASTTHTPLAASSPAALDSLLHGLGRARAGTLASSFGAGGDKAGSKATPGSENAGTPAGAALAGLGLGLNFGLGGDAQGMGGIGGMGLVEGPGAGGRSMEAVLARTKGIVALLGQRWGRVGQVGLEVCVPRLDLDGMWEDGMGSGPGMGDKSRTYIIAGRSFSVEVEWSGERVRGAVLDLTGKREWQREALVRAGEVLRRDLVGREEGCERGYVGLEAFAANMERLARLDRLGVEKASCFEALDGLHVSLDKLWKWENEKIQERMGKSLKKVDVELEVMCQRSGRPVIHEGKKIGHRIDYWLDRRKAAAKTAERKTESSSTESSITNLSFSDSDKLFSLLLECQPAQPLAFASMRVTEDWIASDIGKEVDADPAAGTPVTSMVNWLDPPPTVVSSGDDHSDPMDIDATIRQSLANEHPAVRFVAKLDPPVTVAYTTAAEMFTALGLEMPPEIPQSYVSLLFPEHPSVRAVSAAPLLAGQHHGHIPDTPLSFCRHIRSFDSKGNAIKKLATYTLFANHLYGKTLTEIPFSHPNQLMTIIPYLRQWAFFGHMLRRSVGVQELDPQPSQPHLNNSKSSDTRPQKHAPLKRTQKGSPQPLLDDDIPSDTDSESDSDPPRASSLSRTSFQPTKNILDSTISDSDDPQDDDEIEHFPSVDLNLTYSPLRRIDVDVSPLYKKRRATVCVGFNAKTEVEIGVGTSGGDKEDGAMDVDSKDVSDGNEVMRVLDISEDLGMVRAWMERQL